MPDRIIYAMVAIGGDINNQHMVKVNEPIGDVDRDNFLITYNDKDWSGFRTLEGCTNQIPGLLNRAEIRLEKTGSACDYKIVER